MAVTQIADVIVNPSEFTDYQVENSLVSTALYRSGVLVQNGLMASQLANGSNNFTIPFWQDLSDSETDVTSDNPAVLSTPLKIAANKQVVRKSFLHQSWSDMNLASELAGADALERIQDRVTAYFDRQYEKRLIASLLGVLYSNVANNASDMVIDISEATSDNPVTVNGTVYDSSSFSASAVIDTAGTMGDSLGAFTAIAMHSDIYRNALKNDLIEEIPQSQGLPIQTFRNMAVLVDDNLAPAAGVYTTILMGSGAVGFAVSAPNTGYGTELERIPGAGNGGGQSILHSRVNVALHPLGFAWSDGSGGSAISGESPTIAELKAAAHWTRAVTQRKSVPLAFLVSK